MSLSQLRTLVTAGRLDEASKLSKVLLEEYKSSESLIDAIYSIIGSEIPRQKRTIYSELTKDTTLFSSSNCVNPAEDWSKYKAVAPNDIFGFTGIQESEGVGFSYNYDGEINLSEGTVYFPLQSTIQTRYCFKFLSVSSEIEIYHCISEHLKPPSINKQATQKSIEKNQIIIDCNPQKGQHWLAFKSKKNCSNFTKKIDVEWIKSRKLSNPTVGIIVPFFEDEQYLDDCLSSIKNQTYSGPIEVIITDDCSSSLSTKRAINICKSHATRLNITYIKHHINKRLSEARNTAIRAKKVDLIQLLDSDDYIHKDCLSLKIKTILDSSKPLLIGSCSKIKLVDCDASLKKINKEPVKSSWSNKSYISFFSELGKCPSNCHGPLFAYPQSLAVGLFSQSVNRGAEDYDFWIRLLNLGYEFATVPFVLGYYRMKKKDQSMAVSDITPHFLETSRILYESYYSPIDRQLTNDFTGWPYRSKFGISTSLYNRNIFERWCRMILVTEFNCLHKKTTINNQYNTTELLSEHPTTNLQVDYQCFTLLDSNTTFSNIFDICKPHINRIFSYGSDTKLSKNELDIMSKLMHITTRKIFSQFTLADEKNILKTQKASAQDEFSKFESPAGSEPDEMEFYRDRYKGKRCFVIGNGPSLNKHDLKLLEDEYTFAVNGFFYKSQDTGFYPTFYVVEDNLVMKENIDQIRYYRPKIRKFFPSEYRKLHPKDGKTTFFTMNRAFYNKDSPYHEIPNFSDDATKRVFCGQSVTIMNLQIAYFMGFQNVYVIGMDFNYQLNHDTQEVHENKVFILSQGDDENHFHPDYFGKGKTWKDPKLHNVEKSYICCRDYYEKNGRKIYNASYGGKLEVFDRVNYDLLFE